MDNSVVCRSKKKRDKDELHRERLSIPDRHASFPGLEAEKAVGSH